MAKEKKQESFDKELTGKHIQRILLSAHATKTHFSDFIGISRSTLYRNCLHQLSPSVFYINKLFLFLQEEQGLQNEDIKKLIAEVKSE